MPGVADHHFLGGLKAAMDAVEELRNFILPQLAIDSPDRDENIVQGEELERIVRVAFTQMRLGSQLDKDIKANNASSETGGEADDLDKRRRKSGDGASGEN